jgi:hypothetical protein
VAGFLKRVATERIGGERPSVVRALVVAAVVGAGAAFVTYKLLRA